MSEYEDQLIRESTGEDMPSFSEEHGDYLESFDVETPTDIDQTPNETGNHNMSKYLQYLTAEIHDMIQNCPCDSAPTIKLLNICEKLNNAISFLAKEQQGECEVISPASCQKP